MSRRKSRQHQQRQQTSAIDLALARPGDRFYLRNGSIVQFDGKISPSNDAEARSYQLSYVGPGQPAILRIRNGRHHPEGESEFDVITKIKPALHVPPPPVVTPPPAATAGTVNLKSLPIGTKLLRRDGATVRLTSKDGVGDYPCKANGETYTEQGTFMRQRAQHERDLVKVLEIPRFRGKVFPPPCTVPTLRRLADSGPRSAKIRQLFPAA